MSSQIGRTIFLIVLLFLMAGCNETFSDPPLDPPVSPSLFASILDFSSDNSSSGLSLMAFEPSNDSLLVNDPPPDSLSLNNDIEIDAGEDDDIRSEITNIHNPEPATMLLWGVGLFGAVLLRKRELKVKD